MHTLTTAHPPTPAPTRQGAGPSDALTRPHTAAAVGSAHKIGTLTRVRGDWNGRHRLTRMLAESHIQLDIRPSSLGFLALHAGLETGTGDLAAAAAAATGASLLSVRQQSNDKRLHVSSNEFHPGTFPALEDLLSGCHTLVSLHGHFRAPFTRAILLGGLNRDLARSMADCLRRHVHDLDVVDDLTRIPPQIAGLNPVNPVNRVPAGVQLEVPHLPDRARPWSPAMDPGHERQIHAGLCEFAREHAHHGLAVHGA